MEKLEENCATECDDVSKLINSTWKEKKGTLNLSHRNMKVIPSSIARLTSLKVLLLNNNSLIMPPDEIQHLNKLEILSLESNELTIFPSGLNSLCSTLLFLNLSQNPLACLPPEIGQLKSLTSLWLEFAQLDSFPCVLHSLCNLCQLSLKGNQISSIPSSMGSLLKLRWLSLAENNIQSIFAEQTFSSMTDLHTIDLGKNELTSVFIVCPSLLNINLSKNRLSELPESVNEIVSAKIPLNKIDLRHNPFAGEYPQWTKNNFVFI